MEFNLIGYENGKEVKVPIPFDEIVKQFWPYHNIASFVFVWLMENIMLKHCLVSLIRLTTVR